MERIGVRVVHVTPMACSFLQLSNRGRSSLASEPTPETRGVWRPRNLMEAPLPEPVSNGSKRSHTNQGYQRIRDEFEVMERHAAPPLSPLSRTQLRD